MTRNLLVDKPYVEIGGVKWATMNIGAETETDYGLYFSWGDTAGYTSGQCGDKTVAYKKPFYEYAYTFNGGRATSNESGLTKYNRSDRKIVLDESDDAAVANWGGDWRMPTTAEFYALGEAVNTAWTADYQGSGVSGLVCTDKTDSSKTLFFPLGGMCSGGSFRGGSFGYYWSSSLNTTDMVNAFIFYLDNSHVYWDRWFSYRFNGCSIRPVLGS